MVPKPHVIDVVDLSDAGGAYWKDCLEGHNTTTIALGGMSNAIAKMIDLVISATDGKPVIRCLALWGHGLVDKDHNPLGIHLVAGGWQAMYHRSAFTNATILTLDASIRRLKPCFRSDGRVELRGCGPAGTNEGIEVMKMLAFRCGVPVQGSTKNQDLMSWRQPVVEVSPSGNVKPIPGIEYNLRT